MWGDGDLVNVYGIGRLVQNAFPVTFPSLFPEDEEVADGAVEEAAAVDGAAGDAAGYEEVGGTAAIEVEGHSDFPWGGGALGNCGGERGEGAWGGDAYPPACAAIGEEDGADGGLLGFQAGDGGTVFHKQGAGLEEFAGAGDGRAGTTADDARGTR